MTGSVVPIFRLGGSHPTGIVVSPHRNIHASTVFCSQFDVDGWFDKIGESTIADAICDRIVHDAYRIVLQGESMRKKNGVHV